jgi:hypothetical protein
MLYSSNCGAKNGVKWQARNVKRIATGLVKQMSNLCAAVGMSTRILAPAKL